VVVIFAHCDTGIRSSPTMRGGLCEPPHGSELMTLPHPHAAHLCRPAAGSPTLGRPALSPPSTAARAAPLTCRAAAAAEGAVVRSKSERSTVRQRRRQGHSEAPPEASDDAPGQVGGIASDSLWALREPDEAPPLEEEEDRADRTAKASPSGRDAGSALDDPRGQRAGAETQSFAGGGGSGPLDGKESANTGSNTAKSHEHHAVSGAASAAYTRARTSAERLRWDVRTMPADAGVEVVEPEVFEAGAPEAVSRRLDRPLVEGTQAACCVTEGNLHTKWAPLLVSSHAANRKLAMQQSRQPHESQHPSNRNVDGATHAATSPDAQCTEQRLWVGTCADATRGARQEWGDGPRGPRVHDAEFSVSVASPEEAVRAAEERRLEEEEAAMQEEVGFLAPPFASAHPAGSLQFSSVRNACRRRRMGLLC